MVFYWSPDFVPIVCPQGEFVDDGTETHFRLDDHSCCIKTSSSGTKRSGMRHSLLLDGQKVPDPPDQRLDQGLN